MRISDSRRGGLQAWNVRHGGLAVALGVDQAIGNQARQGRRAGFYAREAAHRRGYEATVEIIRIIAVRAVIRVVRRRRDQLVRGRFVRRMSHRDAAEPERKNVD